MKNACVLLIGTGLIFASACEKKQEQRIPSNDKHAAVSPVAAPIEAVSLLGVPLARPVVAENRRASLEADLGLAESRYDKDPSNEENIIWLGRRLAYMGRFNDAIAAFTEGLKKFPQSPRLLRHRGHRYITTRKLDEAIADLSLAADLIKDVPDEVEPDGAPNERNIPRSTLKHNILYHLALAQYLRGDFASSAHTFSRCADISTNDDSLVAATHWLYLSCRRAGLNEDAETVLDRISPDMDVIENSGYHRLCLRYKGLLKSEEIVVFTAEGVLQDVAVAYGVAALWGIDPAAAERDWSSVKFPSKGFPTPSLQHTASRIMLESITSLPNWHSFGFIAAEADLARQGKK